MSGAKHTPGELIVKRESDSSGWRGISLVTDGGLSIANMVGQLDDRELANAHRLKIAWNSHDGLVAALEATQWAEYSDPDHGPKEFCPVCRMDRNFGHHETCVVRAALAKAKGQPT